MRPRYLEIEGLQSFQEVQKIDFDHLSETGLFGIFGPTGSGKSTVLDAITLALYGKVHRVNGTQGIVNTNLNILKVSFTFDILKGSTRKTYRVERVYNRKKGSENSCEVKIARLIEVLETGEIPIVDKHGEVSAKVEELLGLKHDDFTRAVVLPQNKFQEFLLMNNSDKSKMLERIFYLEEYGKLLSDKVSKKLNTTILSLTEVNGALSTLGDASDKALDEEKKNMELEESNKEKVIKELKDIESKYNEAKEVWLLTGEFDAVIQKEQLHLVSLNEIKDKKLLCEKAVQAESLIDLIIKHKETEKLLLDTNERLEAALLKLPGQQKELDDAKLQYETITKESEIETPKLVEKKIRLGNALEVKKEVDEINKDLLKLRETFISNKENMTQKDKKIEKTVAEVKNAEDSILTYKAQLNTLKVDADYKNEIQKGIKLEDELKTVKLNMDTQKNGFDQLFSEVEQLQKSLNVISEQVLLNKRNLDTLILEKTEQEKLKPGSRDELTTAIERYHRLKSIFASMKSKNITVELARAKAVKAKEALVKLKSNLCDAENIRVNSESEKRACLMEVEGFKKLIEKNTAYILARNLNEGDPCPVCGSLNHPSLAAESVHEEINKLEKKLEKAETKLKEFEAAFRTAENNCISVTEQIKNMNEQYIQFWKEFGEGEKEYDELTAGIPEEFTKENLEQLEKEIESINFDIEKKSKAIGEWEVNLQTMQIKISKASDQLSTLMVEEEGVKAGLQVNKENLNKTEITLKAVAENHSNINSILNEFLNKYKIQGAESELKRINENDRKIEVYINQ